MEVSLKLMTVWKCGAKWCLKTYLTHLRCKPGTITLCSPVYIQVPYSSAQVIKEVNNKAE